MSTRPLGQRLRDTGQWELCFILEYPREAAYTRAKAAFDALLVGLRKEAKGG